MPRDARRPVYSGRSAGGGQRSAGAARTKLDSKWYDQAPDHIRQLEQRLSARLSRGRITELLAGNDIDGIIRLSETFNSPVSDVRACLELIRYRRSPQ